MALFVKRQIFTTGGKETSLRLLDGTLPPARGGAINFAEAIHPLDYQSAIYILPPDSRHRSNPDLLRQLDQLAYQGKFTWLHRVLKEGFLKPIDGEAIGTITLQSGGRVSHGVFLLVAHFMYELVSKDREVLESCRESIYRIPAIAERFGAKFVGYGAGTSIATKDCTLIEDHPNNTLPTCSGSSGTAIGIRDGTLLAAKTIGLPFRRSHLVVIGPGSVGGPAAWLLSHHKTRFGKFAPRFGRVTLVAQTPGRLKRRRNELENFGVPADKIDTVCLDPNESPENRAKILNAVIATGDVIVLATNVAYAEELGINPASFLPGAIVVDVGRPRNITLHQVKARPDVLFIEGATFFMPGETDASEILQMGGPNCVFGCLAEFCAWALAGHDQSESIGSKLSIDTIYFLEKLFRDYGFRVAGLRMFDRPLKPENITIVREALRQRLDDNRQRQRTYLINPLSFRSEPT